MLTNVKLKQIIAGMTPKERKLLQASGKLRNELAKSGFAKRQYRLAPPNGARRVRAIDDPRNDPREVILSRRG